MNVYTIIVVFILTLIAVYLIGLGVFVAVKSIVRKVKEKKEKGVKK